jgi:hypothetical protein
MSYKRSLFILTRGITINLYFLQTVLAHGISEADQLEWVVTFQNDAIKAQDKRTIYISYPRWRVDRSKLHGRLKKPGIIPI